MIILTYHKINNTPRFQEHIAYLSANYNVLDLEQFISRWHKKSLSSKDVLITFDDGDRSLFENALPVLKSHGVPATVFVITSLIGTRQPFWWDEILHHTGDPEMVRKAKSVTNDERIKYIEDLRRVSDKPPLYAKQLTIHEMQELQSNGISIGNHSHTHPMFDKITAGEAAEELFRSSLFLKKNGFRFFDVFAYPNGNQFQDARRILTTAGTRFAFLFDHRLASNYSDPHAISRLSVNDSTPLWKFRFIVSGLHSRILPWMKATRRLISS